MGSSLKVSRNSLKGYTYQQYICTLFIAKMDVERKITRIVSEDIGTKQFDDIYLETEDGTNYRFQVKNYPETTLDDISITPHIVSIKGNSNQYDPTDNNILIVNTDKISTDCEFWGFPAITKNNILIIPLTPQMVEERLDMMFSNEIRELQIIQKSYSLTSSAEFDVSHDKLPPIIRISTDLQEKTVLLRWVPDDIPVGISYFVGKPGVGKSHFVNEICEKFQML